MALLPMKFDGSVENLTSSITGVYTGVVNQSLYKSGHICVLNFYVPAGITNGNTLMTLPVAPVREEAITISNVTYALDSNGVVRNYGATSACYVQIVFPTNS